MTTSDGPAPKPKDGWDKTSIAVDIIHKVIILIIGSVLAGLFYMFQERQAESRYFSDLMSQRESSESQLRAQMFKTLFDAYFANKLAKPDQGSAQKISSTPSAALDRLKQESMFVDLLSRNFENVDVRPLFEDLDAKFSALLSVPETRITAAPPKITDLQRQTFLARERLRRAAIGASSRQITGLVGAAHATVSTHQITQCEGQEPKLEPALPLADVHPIIDKLKDGAVSMRLVPDSELEPLYLQVTFYDMPSLENTVLPSRKRVALTLARYISRNVCERFRAELDETLMADCDSILTEKQACTRAWIRVVVLPKEYIGARDRPYFNDLLSGAFRAHQ